MADKLTISVTFDPQRGYVTVGSEVPPLSALSLNMLRQRCEAALMSDDVHVVLSLDKAARLERDQRRHERAHTGRERAWPRQLQPGINQRVKRGGRG